MLCCCIHIGGPEAWFLFLEKACAQLISPDEADPAIQYENSESGYPGVALQWLTGINILALLGVYSYYKGVNKALSSRQLTMVTVLSAVVAVLLVHPALGPVMLSQFFMQISAQVLTYSVRAVMMPAIGCLHYTLN